MRETKRTYRYEKGYKYRLKDDVTITVPFRHTIPDYVWFDNWYVRYHKGQLTIRQGYSWDGPSGPVPDRPIYMFPSLVHDAWYQLLREGIVPMHTRIAADEWFGDLCVECGTWEWVADLFVVALKEFGDDALAKPKDIKEMKI